MTAIARREALLDFWTRFYAEQPSTVEVATRLATERGFQRNEIERAREKALELRLYGGELPPCAIGVPMTFRNRIPRRPA